MTTKEIKYNRKIKTYLSHYLLVNKYSTDIHLDKNGSRKHLSDRSIKLLITWLIIVVQNTEYLQFNRLFTNIHQKRIPLYMNY